MKDWITISAFEVVGSALCVASGDGQKIYDRIARILKEGRNVKVSFRNINTLTSAFLNAAIGQLYGEFDTDKIRTGIKIEDMEPNDIALLRRVVDTAKEYFKDPHRFEQIVGEEMGDE
jgi:hypothetical protein